MISKFAVEQLTAKWSRSDGALSCQSKFLNRHLWEILAPKHLQKHRLQELIELGDGFAALGAQGFGLVQNGGNAALFF